MNMANFAKSQMLKYGWTEGKGLGKNENGITEALKPVIKLDNTGIGYENDKFAWLEPILTIKNPAEVKHVSQDISTNDDQDKTFINTYKKSQQEAYGKFQNTSTLQNGNLTNKQNSSAISDKEEPESLKTINLPIFNEELFKACGSRTGHKTARHGHKLGKLKRIALQDNMFLNANVSGVSQSNTNTIVTDTKMIHRKTKVQSDIEETEQENDSNENMWQENVETEISVVKSKTTRKKERRRMDNLSQQLSNICNIEDTESACKSLQQNHEKVHKKKKSKERKKIKQDLNSSRNSLKDKANDKTFETSFSLNENMECKKPITELIKSDKTELDKSEQEKNRNYNKKKRARSQEQDCIIMMDDSEDMYFEKSKKAKKLCKKKFSDCNPLMLNDETNNIQNNEEIDDMQKILRYRLYFKDIMDQFPEEEIYKKHGKTCKKHEKIHKKTYKKYSQLRKKYKTELQELREIYNATEENEKKDEASFQFSMLHNIFNKQLIKVKNSEKCLEEMIKETTKLNFRIQKKKKQRYLAKQKKQIENVIHKLKDKEFSHNINALIKDLTTINITEKANIDKKKLTQTHLTAV